MWKYPSYTDEEKEQSGNKEGKLKASRKYRQIRTSNHYGNARGGKQGHITIHTGFEWAKTFNKTTLKAHVKKHGQVYGTNGYIARAVAFANRVDRANHVSYVRRDGTTVKYSKSTNEFVIVDKKGIVRTYYYPKDGIKEFYKDRRKHK